VLLLGGGVALLPEPACGAAVYSSVDQTSRTAEQYAIIIALHTRGSPGAAKSQKTNHNAAAAIMAQACSVEGVKAVALAHPDLLLFVDAAKRKEALLSSRLLALDPGAIKPYFSTPLSELVALLERLRGKGNKALAAKTQALTEAKRRLSATPKVKLLKNMKQLILENDPKTKGLMTRR